MTRFVPFSLSPVAAARRVFRIRGHQLLCLMTWKGIAFTEDFTRVFNMLVDDVQQDKAILELIAAPDREELPGTKRNAPPPVYVRDRDITALEDIRRETGIQLYEGLRFSPDEETLSAMRQAFRSGATRKACDGCRFDDMCTRIAEEGFADARLQKGRQRDAKLVPARQ